MQITTISSKNQLTLPEALLMQLGIRQNSKVLLQIVKEGLYIQPLRTSVVEGVSGSLKKYISKRKLGVETEEALKQIRKKVSVKLATKK